MDGHLQHRRHLSIDGPIAKLCAEPRTYVVFGLCFGGVPMLLWLVVAVAKPELIWDAVKVFAVAGGAAAISLLWLASYQLTLFADSIVFTKWFGWKLVIPISEVRSIKIASGDIGSGKPYHRFDIRFQSSEGVETAHVNIKIFRWPDVEEFYAHVRKLLPAST